MNEASFRHLLQETTMPFGTNAVKLDRVSGVCFTGLSALLCVHNKAAFRLKNRLGSKLLCSADNSTLERRTL